MTAESGKIPLPPLPPADKDGNRQALKYARASIARTIIERMNAVGISHDQLARAAGVPKKAVNRILKCVRAPDESTITKLDKALTAAATKATQKRSGTL